MVIEPTCVLEISLTIGFQVACEEYATYCTKLIPPPKFDREAYQRMEQAGALATYRLMSNSTLAGFMSIVTSGMPHWGLQVSVVESLFVRPAYRHGGWGLKLIRQAEEFAKDIDSKVIIVNCPFAESILQQRLRQSAWTPLTVSFLKML